TGDREWLDLGENTTTVAGSSTWDYVQWSNNLEDIPAGSNIALDRPYTWNISPNNASTSDSGDTTQLTDGSYATGSPIWQHPSTTVGWSVRQPIQITVDLGVDKPIEGVSFSTAGGSSGVEWPNSIFVFTSDNGIDWYDAGDLVALSEIENGSPPAGGYAAHIFTTTNGLATHGRYLAFLHWGMPYCFSDEIEVYSGPSSFLTLPRGTAVQDLRAATVDRAAIAIFREGIVSDFDTLRTRIQGSTLSPAEKTALELELDGLETDPGICDGIDGTSRAVIPSTDVHAQGLAIYADIRSEEGEPVLRIWGGNRWDPLFPTDARPGGAPAADVDIDMVKNEARGAVINITNGERTEKTLELVAQGVSGGAAPDWLRVREVAWTRLLDGPTSGSALPLAPIAGGVPNVSVPGGLTRQVWIEIDSSTLPAGTTNMGTIAIFEGTTLVGTVPLRVHVTQSAMPDNLSLELGGWDYSDYPTRDINDSNRAAAIAFLQDYDVSVPWAHDFAMPYGQHDAAGVMTNPPSTDVLDAWLANWPDAEEYGVVKTFTSTPTTAAEKQKVRDWISFWAAHVETQGVGREKLIFSFVDEPNTADEDQRIIAVANEIHAAEPTVRVWVNPLRPNIADADPALFDVADTICIQRWYCTGTPDSFIESLVQSGKRVGYYSCDMSARRADPYSYNRLQAWDCFRKDMVEGQFWSFGTSGGASSWTEPLGNWWCSTPQFLDDAGCTTAKHMEGIREGLYDYEYLAMLRDRADAADAAGLKPAAVAAAQALLLSGPADVFAATGANNGTWSVSKDRAEADIVRLQILPLLDELIIPSTDSDGDGIPDLWELQYYDGPTSADPAAISSNGVNTVLEAYIAGFDPTDPLTGFAITGFGADVGLGHYILQWDEATGRVYSIYWTSNLLDGFSAALQTNYAGGVFTDMVHGAFSEGFYRLKVEVTP
ncbi:MAG: hypothetical protein KAI66_03440, partial [Lentisphaeria bacterium]|nr:hypothetical protein [Lentisphaeria bacterium]